MTLPPETTVRLPRLIPVIFIVALFALAGLTACQWRDGPPVSANLLQLLPSGAPGELDQQAEARMQEPLNRDLMLLLRHADDTTATALAESVGNNLLASGLFAQVRHTVDADLAAIRRQLLDQRLALLDSSSREALMTHPEAFVQQRLQRLYTPFEGSGLLPVEQDWFGIAELAQQALPQPGNVRADPDGHLLAEYQGQRWMVIHAQTHGDAFDESLPLQVETLLAETRQQIEHAKGELLATGGLLFAAHGQRQARDEASLIGSLSLLAAVGLLLALFRTPRVLLIVLPVAVGALSGAAACIALFGQIHVLTLVLGTSLVGVSIDFPLHYLSKSWTLQPWNSHLAMRLTLPGLVLALLTNVIGYLAMAFTPFPALTQVAVFSAAGLAGAFACATCLLPWLLRAPLQPWSKPLAWAHAALQLRQRLLGRIASFWLLVAFALYCAMGVPQVTFTDDLRQWVSRAQHLQAEAERIGRISGFEPTSQYYLLRADSTDELLANQHKLSEALAALVAEGRLGSYLSLSQIATPLNVQKNLQLALPRLLDAAEPLLALGVTREQLQAELALLQAQPGAELEDVLAGPLGEPWRPLWLGRQADGSVAGLVSLQGLKDSDALAGVGAEIKGLTLVDRPRELNQLFGETKAQAALFKLLAAVLILVLLFLPFGWRGAARCLAVPLLAALGSLATLGWLGQSLTLFGLFGLLLVTAIGVDYAILMREQVGGAAVCLVGTALAASTTLLSFGMLALSNTPAVSNFGLAVGLGLLFAFLMGPWARSSREAQSP